MAGTASEPTFDEAIALLRRNSPGDLQHCIELLFKILRNAAPKAHNGPPHLGTTNHRRLRKANKALGAVTNCKGGVRFLRAAGFVDDETGEFLVLPDTADPARAYSAREQLRALVHSMAEEAERVRAEEREHAAQRLAELKELQARNAQAKNLQADAERERILREMKAERFEKERQADPTDFR